MGSLVCSKRSQSKIHHYHYQVCGVDYIFLFLYWLILGDPYSELQRVSGYPIFNYKQAFGCIRHALVSWARDNSDQPISLEEVTVDNVTEFTTLSDGTIIHSTSSRQLQGVDGNIIKLPADCEMNLVKFLTEGMLKIGNVSNKDKSKIRARVNAQVRSSVRDGHDTQSAMVVSDDKADDISEQSQLILPTRQSTIQSLGSTVNDLTAFAFKCIQEHFDSQMKEVVDSAIAQSLTMTDNNFFNHKDMVKKLLKNVAAMMDNEQFDTVTR
jgi:hypothetical protein